MSFKKDVMILNNIPEKNPSESVAHQRPKLKSIEDSDGGLEQETKTHISPATERNQ